LPAAGETALAASVRSTAGGKGANQAVAARLCVADVFQGRFGRLTLKKIETVLEDGKKVTVSCEPKHQFFAGRFAASVLTHNYTFSS